MAPGKGGEDTQRRTELEIHKPGFPAGSGARSALAQSSWGRRGRAERGRGPFKEPWGCTLWGWGASAGRGLDPCVSGLGSRGSQRSLPPIPPPTEAQWPPSAQAKQQPACPSGQQEALTSAIPPAATGGASALLTSLPQVVRQALHVLLRRRLVLSALLPGPFRGPVACAPFLPGRLLLLLTVALLLFLLRRVLPASRTPWGSVLALEGMGATVKSYGKGGGSCPGSIRGRRGRAGYERVPSPDSAASDHKGVGSSGLEPGGGAGHGLGS